MTEQVIASIFLGYILIWIGYWSGQYLNKKIKNMVRNSRINKIKGLT